MGARRLPPPPPITLLLFPGGAVNKSQTQEAADIKTCPPAWGRGVLDWLLT